MEIASLDIELLNFLKSTDMTHRIIGKMSRSDSCYRTRPLKVASPWAGCLQALRFHGLCSKCADLAELLRWILTLTSSFLCEREKTENFILHRYFQSRPGLRPPAAELPQKESPADVSGSGTDRSCHFCGSPYPAEHRPTYKTSRWGRSKTHR